MSDPARVDELDIARAQEYTLLSRLLLQSPNEELLAKLADLRGNDTPLGKAHVELSLAASRSSAKAARREHFALFSGVGRAELLPYASFYLTGFVQGRPLADVRQAMTQLGIESSESQREPEDHAGILLEIMAGLLDGSLQSPSGGAKEFFKAHLAPWMDRFFADLEKKSGAGFYAKVGSLGRTFMQIERESLELQPNP